MTRKFTKYPSNYVNAESNLTFKRRGKFLDSSDGRWVICKHDKSGTHDKSYYYVLDKTTHEYLESESGGLAFWYSLKDAQTYLQHLSNQL